MMLNKKLKRVITCAALIFCMMSTTAFAGTWQEQYAYSGYPEWRYIKDNGEYAKSEWIYDNGSWYYINSTFQMVRGIPSSITEKALGGNYCFEQSGKLSTGGFVEGSSGSGIRYFADKDGHTVDGLFMVDGVLYEASYDIINANYVGDSTLIICNESYDKYDSLGSSRTESEVEKYKVKCKFVNGIVLDTDGKPFAADSKIFTQVKYLPKYDSKGNLIGAIENPNGYRIF